MVETRNNMYHNCSQCVAHFCTADKRQNFFFSPQQSAAASEKRKSFSKCNTKRWGDKIHFCTSSFETSIKCDPRARGIMNSYTLLGYIFKLLLVIFDVNDQNFNSWRRYLLLPIFIFRREAIYLSQRHFPLPSKINHKQYHPKDEKYKSMRQSILPVKTRPC